MKKRILTLLTTLLLTTPYSYAYKLDRISVHDPSVVWEPSTGYYYIFGSHLGAARTKNLTSWTSVKWIWGRMNEGGNVVSAGNEAAFRNCQTKTVVKGGEEVEFPAFDAYEWSAAYGDYSIGGNMWAPDVIYNEAMGKWCMYMSINGPKWNSSIVLLTSDKITGPYLYQGPVVVSGFNVSGCPAALDYKNTDLELAIGKQTSLPSRYTAYWGRRWPHCIDPCVFYDEQSRLWMSYGSWSGGIWMLELNKETGLRNYDARYPSTNGNTDGVTSDPYFGRKIAGGFYSSGEGSYIEHIGSYYFLFISNGGLAAGGNADDYNNGGYQMRVLRSKNPTGPYVDASGKSAILTDYELNFGPNSSTRGVNIFGAYGNWGDMLASDGERSQGHNSIIAAPDGRTYLVYHTRFQNSGEWHQVRVHQVFQNRDGWLVAAPFEYTGEQVTSADIAATQQVETARIAGTYQLLVHKYGLDHRKKELSTPTDITLYADGTVSGEKSGKWSCQEGTSYISLTLDGVLYKGVMVEQIMEPSQTKKVPAFTALAASGVTVWGYRTDEDPTPIGNPVQAEKDGSRGAWYDLQGRCINSPQHRGIYIRDGRSIYWNGLNSQSSCP